MKRKNTSAEFIKTCLAEALVKLMYEKNYNEITVTDICKRAGFGRTTYYRYFNNNKDELFLYIAHIRWEECKRANPEKQKENEGGLLIEHLYRYKEVMLMLQRQGVEYLIVKMLFEELGVKEGEEEILRYGKAFFIGAYYGVIYEWMSNGCVDTPEEIGKKFQQAIEFAIKSNS